MEEEVVMTTTLEEEEEQILRQVGLEEEMKSLVFLIVKAIIQVLEVVL